MLTPFVVFLTYFVYCGGKGAFTIDVHQEEMWGSAKVYKG